MILLQLAYIPDCVITDVDFTKPGWSYKFKERMNKFKADFEAKHGSDWTFQDEFTEERYTTFKEEKDKAPGGFSYRELDADEVDAIRSKKETYQLGQSGIMGGS